jgi:DNA-directed RNA polymerase subunit RPC12/RpoP
MKLYTCKYCNIEIKSRDVRCPWCGRKILFNGKRFTNAGWAIYLLLFASGIVLILIGL